MPAGSNAIFVSSCTSPYENGDLVFTLETFDAAPNIAITLSVTGILTSYTETDLATSINTQLTSQLIPYKYNGNALFSDTPFTTQFRVSQTEHITSIWSQCGYDFRLISNTTGANIKVSTRPVLMTVAKAKDFAAIKGFEFTDVNGNSLSDSQITDLNLRGSTQIISFLRINVAITTYLNTIRGQDNKSVFLKPTPGVARDTVMVRRKAYINLYTNPTYMTFTFYYNRYTGELNYRPSSTVVNTKSPFDLDNEVQVTLTAGYYNIPEEIFWALTDLNELNLLGLGNIESLKGGTGEIKFQDSQLLYNRIFSPIKHLRSI